LAPDVQHPNRTIKPEIAMQLTRAADYAVRVMVYMAGLAPGSRVSRTALAACIDCPEQFLSKVLQSLTKAGLITSHRGNTGGFELPPSRHRTSVMEIIEAVEGPICLNICLNSRNECRQAENCPAYPVWIEAQNAITTVLRGARVEELARRAQPARPSEPIRLDETPRTENL
jgi:Rrf2 family protein